jgi:capsular exopolysaccharide synthesis family protein
MSVYSNSALYVVRYPDSDIANSYREIKTNLLYSGVKAGNPLRTILLTSMNNGEGKSFTSTNLAATLALEGRKTLLVDVNLHHPSLSQYFYSGNHEFGLTSYLEGDYCLSDVVQDTQLDNLQWIASGPVPDPVSRYLNHQRMDRFLEEAKEQYDMVLLDGCSLESNTDVRVVGGRCDGVLLVTGQGKVRRNEARKRIAIFQILKLNLLGVVLNRTRA